MLDLKQLQYFVVSADVGSFSEAARILYTTQSNVSKNISALEKNLNVQLFVRGKAGIRLTKQGERIYEHAAEIMRNSDELENVSKMNNRSRLNISINPSSWFAHRFSEFYMRHKADDYYYHIKNVSSEEAMKRVSEGRDEIGFVYLLDVDDEGFRYRLSKKGLEFHKLIDVGGQLHLGRKHAYHVNSGFDSEDASRLRFVQMYQDDFLRSAKWNLDDEAKTHIVTDDVAVITNSDYIMKVMLDNTDIANISGIDFEDRSKETAADGPMLCSSNSVSYGYIKRKNESLSAAGHELAAYIGSCLRK